MERTMRYEGEHFSKQRVQLDGNQFEGCRFTDVIFDYAGGPIHLSGCTFEGLCWQLGGDLARGLAVLGKLHASDQAAALSLIAKAMFEHVPSTGPTQIHPSLAAILEAAEAPVPPTKLPHSRLHNTIRRNPQLARAA
jgi:hypothetical protein